MNPIEKLHAAGQSIWYDNIHRRMLENGELKDLIERGQIRGLTSNPTIFHNAIAKSDTYDAVLKPMARGGSSPEEIFYQLAVEDIQAAADLFAPLYRETRGADGYVSLEVSPLLADDTEATVDQARQLWQRVNRPNLMVKIPATRAGIPAIQRSIAAGVNVNVTLIFSLDRYREVMEAYISGLEERLENGHPLDHIASVASFFVSRVDTKVDGMLDEVIRTGGEPVETARQLLGRAAIANARRAYALFEQVFSQERFKLLAAHGARVQRPLWASTSTKNPAYRDVLYVEELIGPQTVNTVPPQTLVAFADHGQVAVRLGGNDLEAAEQVETDLASLGISMKTVTAQLEEEGVKAFADSFNALLETIAERSTEARQEPA